MFKNPIHQTRVRSVARDRVETRAQDWIEKKQQPEYADQGRKKQTLSQVPGFHHSFIHEAAGT